LSQSILKRGYFKTKYLSTIESMNKKSSLVYRDHLKPFESFAMNRYDLDLDSLIINIREGKYNPYNILSEFAAYLRDPNFNRSLSSIT
jgi:hypothetical protein